MRDKLIELLKMPVCVEGDCENCEGLESGALCAKVHYGKQADHLIANGVTFADDNNVGDKEMIRHLFNRCAAITQCGLCFCCGYQKECESARDVRKGW